MDVKLRVNTNGMRVVVLKKGALRETVAEMDGECNKEILKVGQVLRQG